MQITIIRNIARPAPKELRVADEMCLAQTSDVHQMYTVYLLLIELSLSRYEPLHVNAAGSKACTSELEFEGLMLLVVIVVCHVCQCHVAQENSVINYGRFPAFRAHIDSSSAAGSITSAIGKPSWRRAQANAWRGG